MTSGYRFIIHSDAFRLLLAYRSEEREILCDFFQYLASNPSLVGEYEERDREGHVYEVIQVRRWLVTFYTDHAAKEVRIVRIEQL